MISRKPKLNQTLLVSLFSINKKYLMQSDCFGIYTILMVETS